MAKKSEITINAIKEVNELILAIGKSVKKVENKYVAVSTNKIEIVTNEIQAQTKQFDAIGKKSEKVSKVAKIAFIKEILIIHVSSKYKLNSTKILFNSKLI